MQLSNKVLLAGLAMLVIVGMMGTASAQGDFNVLGLAIAGTLCFVLVVTAIIWIGIAFWMYKDAKKRGKNGVMWGIFGLLFGIIALIIWLIVRK